MIIFSNHCSIGMETTLSYTSIAWRSCCRFVSHPSRSRRAYCSRNTTDNDAEELFEAEEFCSSSEKSILEIDSEESNILDTEMKEKMKVLLTEMYLLKESGAYIPNKLSLKQCRELLMLRSQGTRANYLRKMYLFEQKKLSQSKVQGIIQKLHMEEKSTNSDKGPIIEKNSKKNIRYGLNFNTLFRGIYTKKMNEFYHYRLLKTMMYGPDLIVDCGYENTMNHRDIKRCAREIHDMWQENKTYANPFNIHFCNLDENGQLFPRVRNQFLDFDEPDLPFNYTSLSYLDLYERNKLVYLTPYSSQVLTYYRFEDTYIIGAVMNNSIRGRLSLAKAKKEKLRTAKLPLNDYVPWNIGFRSLESSKVLAIMHDIKEKHDWLTIFRQHVPPVKTAHEFAQEKKIKKMQESIDSSFSNS